MVVRLLLDKPQCSGSPSIWLGASCDPQGEKESTVKPLTVDSRSVVRSLFLLVPVFAALGCSGSPGSQESEPTESEPTENVGQTSAAIDDYCSPYNPANGNTIRYCNAYAGTWQYTTYDNNLGPPNSPSGFAITNNTGGDLIVLSVQAATQSGNYNFNADFCTNRNWGTVGPQGQPGQSSLGTGEVACVFKPYGQGYAPIYYTGYEGSGLVLHPHDLLAVGAGAGGLAHTFTVQIAAGASTNEALTIRQPQWDFAMPCSGGQQNSPVQVYKNTTGGNLYIDGTMIYGNVNGSACVQVLNTSGAARWTYCNGGLQSNGFQRAWNGMVAVFPNEFVFGIGYNTCSSGNWDYAQYITAKFTM
jgi:hypothetical protein